MKINVTVKPQAKCDKVEKMEAGHYRVRVKAPPIEGRANEAAVKALASYFKVPRRGVRLLKGAASKQKVFEIDEG